MNLVLCDSKWFALPATPGAVAMINNAQFTALGGGEGGERLRRRTGNVAKGGHHLKDTTAGLRKKKSSSTYLFLRNWPKMPEFSPLSQSLLVLSQGLGEPLLCLSLEVCVNRWHPGTPSVPQG